MNGVQLTFFNFAGYLVPGIVGLIAFSPLFYLVPALRPFLDMSLAIILTDEGTIQASAVAALLIPGIALSFLFGVMISDTAIVIVSKIRSKSWGFHRRSSQSRFAHFRERGWDDVVEHDPSIKEALALQATAGWDIYGSAARARMCNAVGFVLFVASLFYVFFSITLFATLFPLAISLIVLGLKRHADYVDFVDTIAFVQTRVHSSAAGQRTDADR